MNERKEGSSLQVPYFIEEEQKTSSLTTLLQSTALFLWKDWSTDMQATLISTENKTFTFRGVCPHCGDNSVFVLATSVAVEYANNKMDQVWIAAMRCQGCFDYILGIVRWEIYNGVFKYVNHFPLGKPSDKVAEEIPEHIRPDFQEALRCLSVNAYNATGEMCRRAIEASCIDLGAPQQDVLNDMIDWLEAKRIITPGLKDVAHKVRLGGNKCAHPAPPDQGSIEPQQVAVAVEKIEEEHAQAIVDFTRHFFQYVYVTPKQLNKYDFSKPKTTKRLKP
jgi:hypothetical protein